MKGSEIRAQLQRDHDPKLVHCICSLAEVVSAQRQEIMQIAQMIDLQSGIIKDLVNAAENIQSITDKLRGMRGTDA